MKEILKNLDIDTIIPHGGGIESAAAVAWAKRVRLKPLLLSLDMGDVPKVRHTIEAVKTQISRTPYLFPELHIDDELTDIDNINENYFTLYEYNYHPKINASMIA